MDIKGQITDIGVEAKAAARELRALGSRRKGSILQAMADALDASRDEILDANAADVEAAESKGISPERLRALKLDGRGVTQLVRDIGTMADLKDPIGREVSRWIRPNGIEIVRQLVPIGVVAVPFGLRSGAVAQSMAMCVKTANALVLHGSDVNRRTAEALHGCLLGAALGKGVPEGALTMIPSHSSAALKAMVNLNGLVDLVIPCDGPDLESEVLKHASVPVVQQSWCGSHVYVDAQASLPMALEIVTNTVCGGGGLSSPGGATLLVHQDVAEQFLPMVSERLEESAVRFLGHGAARHALNDLPEASDSDWCSAGAGGYLCIRVVKSVAEAVSHITCYGSGHSECIVTEDDVSAKLFVRSVDAPCVYVNASAALTSGVEFGMGAELAVSVGKLHARGPIGLDELTTYHYVIQGNGQVAE